MTLIRILRNRVGRCRDACELAVNHGTPRRAAKLAVVVGTLLVLINQWEAVAGSVSMDWLKLVLTYCVPYLVSTYTSVSKDLYLLREAEAAEQKFLVGPPRGVSAQQIAACTQVADKGPAVLAHHQVHFHGQILPAAEFAIDVVTGYFGQVPAH